MKIHILYTNILKKYMYILLNYEKEWFLQVFMVDHI